MRSSFSKRLNWDNALAILLGLQALLFIWLASSVHVFLAGDPVAQFSLEAVGLLSGQGIQSFSLDTARGPLFPALVAGVAWVLGGDVFTAGLAVECASYLLFSLAVFAVVRASFGAKVGLLSAAILGANGAVLRASLGWLTDVPFAALALASLWCLYGSQRHWVWAALSAGLLAGLAFDTRWNGAFLLAVGVLAAVLNPWQWRPARAGVWLLLFAAGFGLVALPWLAMNNTLHGAPFYNGLDQTGLDSSLLLPALGPTPALKDAVLTDPLFFFPRYFRRLLWDGLFQVAQILPVVLAVFIPAGALVWLRQFDRRQALLLIFAGVYWSLAVLTHFEARYYFPLLPIMAAVPLFFLVSEGVPDVQLRGRYSLKTGLLLGALAVICFSTIRAAQTGVENTNAAFTPQPEAAQVLAAARQAGQPGTQVAVQYFSGARYFIPHTSGLPVGILKPPELYFHLPAAYSHVLVEEAVPARGAQPEVPLSLFEPLSAPANLEALYFKSAQPRAVLYQVIRDNQLWPVQIITVSAALDTAHGPPAVLDSDSQSGWLTPPLSAPDAPATLTADLGRAAPVNRVWLLPPADPSLWPESYQLETSVDGAVWAQVAVVGQDPLNQRQNPRVFSFPTQSVRFVRLTVLRLRANPAGQYQAGLNGIRVSLAPSREPTRP